MRISRKTILRFLSMRESKWRSCLQITLLLGLLLFSLAYFKEKSRKEALIELALESAQTDALVKPENDTLLLNGLFRGSGRLEGKVPFIVIGVTSIPENEQRRNIIRKSWANKAFENHGAIVIFFLGRPSSQQEMENLAREAESYEDLIVDDFQESYYALSVKSLRLIKYFKFYHPKSRFLIKTDDDVFVNVRNLVHYCFKRNQDFESKLHQHHEDFGDENENPDSVNVRPFHFLGGVIHYDRAPHTWNPFSKWYAPAIVWNSVYSAVVKLRSLSTGHIVDTIDSESYLKEVEKLNIRQSRYPPYAEGNFYVLSDDTALEILETSRKVPLYHLEDVFVTGVLATWMLGIDKENMPFISSASNIFPTWSYWWYSKFYLPEEIIAFHCDNSVGLIATISIESLRS